MRAKGTGGCSLPLEISKENVNCRRRKEDTYDAALQCIPMFAHIAIFACYCRCAT